MKTVVLPPKSDHPSGDQELAVKNPLLEQGKIIIKVENKH